jgi:hypothetical protein
LNTSANQSYSFSNADKGSILAATGARYIPGLSGRLNPIKDTLDRLCLYAEAFPKLQFLGKQP